MDTARRQSHHSFSAIVSALSGLAVAVGVLTNPVTPTSAQSAYSQRVRVGAATTFTDAAGLIWSADRAYTPGSFGYTHGADTWSSSATIANTTDDPLFQNNRHDTLVSYRFDMPNGNYHADAAASTNGNGDADAASDTNAYVCAGATWLSQSSNRRRRNFELHGFARQPVVRGPALSARWVRLHRLHQHNLDFDRRN